MRNAVFNISLMIVGVALCYSCHSKWEIDNPYEGVDWMTAKQYKANFHTHTTVSDGRLNPQTVVDLYSELGYDILAITDHGKFNHPWTHFSKMEVSDKSLGRMKSQPETMPLNFDFEDRNPSDLQLIDVQGCELSLHHHIGSYFSNYTGAEDLKVSLEAVKDLRGIGIVNHPGRYNHSAEWYLELFKDNPHLIGEEVYNRGDRYPNMREKWDSLLTISMPMFPVWGFSNDDMHTIDHLGRNWNMLILPELNHSSVKKGMKNGHSYFV